MTRLSSYLLLLAIFLPAKAISQSPPKNLSVKTHETGPVTIGLLLPDYSCTDVINAAEFAIKEANAAGGYGNQDFILVTRTAEGFWGAGSKESVNLVYEDQVCAIIGSLDGRNGHLAEQVAAKSHLTYIETFATDPTLSQAFVPWFMRVVPNDNQQSDRILDQIRREGGGNVAILSNETYDTRYAVRSLTKEVASETGISPLVIDLDTVLIDQKEVMEKILHSKVVNLVIPFDAGYMKDLISSLKQANPDLNIFGTLHFTMGMESRESGLHSYEGVYLVTPLFDKNRDSALQVSRSAYMYDAINLVINAIHHVGTDREAITDYISGSEFSTGITGTISFDDLGNRQGASTLVRIRNGVPQLIQQP